VARSMTVPSRGREPFAMLPESVITGELEPGVSTQARAMAVLLFCYLDLRQGKHGNPVRGYRYIATKLGVQERSVKNAAAVLERCGLIEVTRSGPPYKSAVLRVIHNPARGRSNPSASIGPVPHRYRHDPLPYGRRFEPGQGSPQSTRKSRQSVPDSDAQAATGSRSLRSGWFDEETASALRAIATQDPRCERCVGLLATPRSWRPTPAEFCGCPFEGGKRTRRDTA
jgi:hypothetical protein